MRVLVACEFSGIVRDAFLARGHNAWSCDLLPTESPIQNGHTRGHLIMNALRAITLANWDLMIAHPPCTYLTNAGARWLYKGGKGTEIDPVRWAAMEDAARFFKLLLNCGIPRICVENPIMHRHARGLVGAPYSQTIQPWQFGHGEVKATCLWLKGLPKLIPTGIVSGREPRVHHASPGPDRWKVRSRTLSGIAAAMAEQWSNPVEEPERWNQTY